MNILSRFGRIRSEFGTWMLVRTALLLIAAVGIAAVAFFGFDSILPAVIVVVGLFAGWILRRQIVHHFDFLQWVLPGSLFVYGMVLFIGERVIGISRTTQALVIVVVSVITFGIQFWSLSDPEIVNIADG
ncbi:MAG: hypothetical protein ABL984_03460 [Pyrinomonadaceae bacterium]